MEMAMELIQIGANCLLKNLEGRTVFYIALETELLQIILQMNPELDLNAPISDNDLANLPLHVAVKYDRGDLIPILIESGADPERCYARGHTPLTRATNVCSTWAALTLLAAGVNAHTPGLGNFPPIVDAVDKGLIEIVVTLITEHNVDVNIEYLGFYLLYRAVFFNNIPMIFVLANFGADLNVIVDENGHTPLTRSIFNSKIDISLELIRCGADVFRSLNDSESSRTGMFL
eukprot:gene1973-3839_t